MTFIKCQWDIKPGLSEIHQRQNEQCFPTSVAIIYTPFNGNDKFGRIKTKNMGMKRMVAQLTL